MLHDIFLSYSRKDSRLMQRVRDDLRAAGLRVWTDEGIRPGTALWKDAIEQAIREAHLLVVLMSPNSKASLWVKREIDYASAQGVQVLSLLIDGDDQTAVPFALIGSQYIDIRNRYKPGLEKLIKEAEYRIKINMGGSIQAPAPKHTQSPSFGWLRAMLMVFIVVIAGGLLLGGWAVAAGDTAWLDDVRLILGIGSPVVRGDALLRYHGGSLVILNNSDDVLDLRDVRFLSENGAMFIANDWGGSINAMRPGRCAQAWHYGAEFMAADEPPADVCVARVRYRATRNVFWDETAFRVIRDGQTLATCPAARGETIIECGFNLPD